MGWTKRFFNLLLKGRRNYEREWREIVIRYGIKFDPIRYQFEVGPLIISAEMPVDGRVYALNYHGGKHPRIYEWWHIVLFRWLYRALRPMEGG